MDRKTSFPDSDKSVRGHDISTHAQEGIMEDGAQTSHKSGKHSSAEKLTASRPEGGVGVGAKHVDGAHGRPDEHHETPHKGNYGVQGEVSNKAAKHRKEEK